MQIADLSPIRRHGLDARAEGWLGSEGFHAGVVPADLLERLTKLVVFKSSFFGSCLHPCPLCGSERVEGRYEGAIRILGTAELWIPDERCWFASPNLLLHYISAHGYCPPAEYLTALASVDFDASRPPGR